MRLRPVVLIADDTLDHLDLYELALADQYTIVRARNGDEAFVAAVAERPDAIVLDALMPGGDGFTTCAKLRAGAPTARIPVVLLTAMDACDVEARAILAGAVMVLHKPCSAERLARTIDAAIAASKAVEERR